MTILKSILCVNRPAIYMQTIAWAKIEIGMSLASYLLWRVMTGKNKKIVLPFMCVGHTRCIVDGNFGLIKQVYRHSDIDIVAQLCDIVYIYSRLAL